MHPNLATAVAMADTFITTNNTHGQIVPVTT
jgi:hypothetical protein